MERKNKTLAVALIGAGRIGAMHARLVAAHPRARLSAVVDANMDAAKAAAEECGAPAVQDAGEAVAAADAVLVASATGTHCDYIELAAAAGKPVLCEKPIDMDTARVNDCRNKLPGGAAVQIGFNRRFDPGHNAVQRRIAAGEIGKLEKLVITSRDPAPPSADYLDNCGGIFRDMMIHDFDLARFMLADEPARLFAAGAALVMPERGADIDTAMAVLQTASGVLCHINCSRRAAYGYDQRVEAFGEKGMLVSNNRTATEVAFFGKEQTAAREPLLHFFTERYADSFRLQLDAFVNAVCGGAEFSPTFEDGRRASILADAAEESLKSGQWAALDFGG